MIEIYKNIHLIIMETSILIFIISFNAKYIKEKSLFYKILILIFMIFITIISLSLCMYYIFQLKSLQ